MHCANPQETRISFLFAIWTMGAGGYGRTDWNLESYVELILWINLVGSYHYWCEVHDWGFIENFTVYEHLNVVLLCVVVHNCKNPLWFKLALTYHCDGKCFPISSCNNNLRKIIHFEIHSFHFVCSKHPLSVSNTSQFNGQLRFDILL